MISIKLTDKEFYILCDSFESRIYFLKCSMSGLDNKRDSKKIKELYRVENLYEKLVVKSTKSGSYYD